MTSVIDSCREKVIAWQRATSKSESQTKGSRPGARPSSISPPCRANPTRSNRSPDIREDEMHPVNAARLRRAWRTRVLFLLALALAAATMCCVGAPAAWAANVTCTGMMSGDSSGPLKIDGNVTVPQGANCTLSFVTVSGNVQASKGSTLLITGYTEPSTIGGNVQAENCYSALLEGSVTIGGNLQIQGCNGNGPNGFQGPDIVINGNFQC